MLPILAMAMQLCLATLSVTTLVHADDDALCNPQLVLHDHDAHGVRGERTAPTAPEHCFICHSLSLRALLSTLRVAPPDPAVGIRAEGAVSVPVVAFRHRLPARAPPLA